MAYRYDRINWQNKPNVATPISAENLNKMDKGIDDNDKAIGDLAQLNTSNKSSLVSAVNELNNNFATQYGSLIPGDYDISDTQNCYVKKSGKSVQLSINVVVSSSDSGEKIVCYIPVGFRPARSVYALARASQSGGATAATYVSILNTGKVSVVVPVNSNGIVFNVTWLID